MVNRQPCTTVHRNSAIFELSKLLTISCSHTNVMMIIKQFKTYGVDQQHANTHKPPRYDIEVWMVNMKNEDTKTQVSYY